MTASGGFRQSGGWTEERTQTLLALNAAAQTSLAIAQAMGISTSCVVGRLQRLGVVLVSKRANNAVLAQRFGRTGAKSPPHKPGRAPALEIVPPTAKPDDERGRGECDWPFGEWPNAMSCCAKVKPGSHWCEAHHKRGHQPASGILGAEAIARAHAQAQRRGAA